MGVAEVKRSTVGADGDIVAEIVVVDAVAGGHPAYGQGVAGAAEVIDTELGAVAGAAGVAAAPVVAVEGAAGFGRGGCFYGQVGGAGLFAGRQGGLGVDAGEVVDEKQGPFERLTGNDGARTGGEQHGAQAVRGDRAVTGNVHLAVGAGDDGDFDDAVPDILGRQVGKGDEVALPAEILGDFAGQPVQFTQGTFFAGFVLHDL
ncbi:hypothetical protein SAMN04490355_103214 [Pelosinus propionicus DSM 13327]|uniref:Uncharacterized protein n=1 Tax=Pelosinus propionicus DSM 13327 TaxID=1123291 RepID=A0A1I4MBM3_9FIRM|nr:hypothetical protein SAMN04490355_103214 [Pelosinus propionicus DSM 13327]